MWFLIFETGATSSISASRKAMFIFMIISGLGNKNVISDLPNLWKGTLSHFWCWKLHWIQRSNLGPQNKHSFHGKKKAMVKKNLIKKIWSMVFTYFILFSSIFKTSGNSNLMNKVCSRGGTNHIWSIPATSYKFGNHKLSWFSFQKKGSEEPKALEGFFGASGG